MLLRCAMLLFVFPHIHVCLLAHLKGKKWFHHSSETMEQEESQVVKTEQNDAFVIATKEETDDSPSRNNPERTNPLDKLSSLISSIFNETFNEKNVSIFHTGFFNTLESQGWEQARVYAKTNEKEWDTNEFAASLDAQMVLVPCYVKADDTLTSGRWVLLARYMMERRQGSFFRVDVLGEILDDSLVNRFKSMFMETPFAPGTTKWRLQQTNMKIEGVDAQDSEARVAGWIGVIAIRTEMIKAPRFVKSVTLSALQVEGENISNIAEERRKWLDDCIDENVFLAPKEYEKKNEKRWLHWTTPEKPSSVRLPYILPNRRPNQEASTGCQNKVEEGACKPPAKRERCEEEENRNAKKIRLKEE